MARTEAIEALDNMREELGDGNLSAASMWALIYLAESEATAVGLRLRALSAEREQAAG